MKAILGTALALSLLTGCAPKAIAFTTLSKPPGATEAQWEMEQMKAGCMKKKGFKYVPHVSRKPEKTDPQRRAAEGDHVAARELRAKYGHQIFASYVYPDDPAAGALVAGEDDRYVNLLGRLNDSQLIAYQADLKTCAHEAFKAVLHKEVKSFFDLTTQRWDALQQLRKRRLDGDPRLVEQAVAFGDCLVAKGYRVTSRKPTDLAQRGSRTFGAQLKTLNQGEREPTAKQARPYLTREIEDALDDLACGKDFYARHSPADSAIIEEIDAEFGM